MKYTEEMILQSPSGYCMPFEEEKNKEVTLSKGYGELKDTVTGETSFNHGIDFNASHRPLAAVASGVVSSIGTDKEHGVYIVIRYGKYEVTYAHLANIFIRFGQKVKAGQTVAISGNDLHMEVAFDGEELNPIEFLTMLYGNIQALRKAGHEATHEFIQFDGEMKTRYDRDKEEIEELMIRFLPVYMEDLFRGAYTVPEYTEQSLLIGKPGKDFIRAYTVPEYTEQSLRNVFAVGATKNYFFEKMPSMANPLGIGSRALPLASKVQNLLIADFLNYLALRHNVYLSTMGEEVKKNFNPRP